MPEERIIPAVQSVAEFVIKVGGNPLPRATPLLLVQVASTANKIAYAKIIVEDGDATNGLFPQSDGDFFLPGNEIEILAGDPEDQASIFEGVITKHAISLGGHRGPQLVVECRHKLYKAAIHRSSAVYYDKTDSEIMEEILLRNGITDIDIATTSVRHKELVQYHCSDWDFLVSRAEQCGLLVLTDKTQVRIIAPDYSADAALSLLHGASIIDLDAEIDGRLQYQQVKTTAWNPAEQALVHATADSAPVAEQGNLDAATIAAGMEQEAWELKHGAAIPEAELNAWAQAQLHKRRSAKVRGRVKFEGIATIHAGDLVSLDGVGQRFKGKALVTGVRQDFTLTEGWKTHAQFGASPDGFISGNEVAPPKAGGLLPGAVGLHTGVVTDNEDPEGEFRVRVKIPMVHTENDGVWARMALADAGGDRGLYFRPEIGDEVLVGFLYDDPRYPVIMGMLHSSAKASPQQPANENHIKGYTSRSGMKLHFDDERNEVLVATPAGNKVLISDTGKSITLADQNSNTITLDPGGITIDDAGVNVITLDKQGGKLTIKAGVKVIVDAPQIELVDSATHPLVFGDELLNYLNQIVQIYQTHMHPGELALGTLPVTPAPPVPPMPPATPALLSFKVKTG